MTVVIDYADGTYRYIESFQEADEILEEEYPQAYGTAVLGKEVKYSVNGKIVATVKPFGKKEDK